MPWIWVESESSLRYESEGPSFTGNAGALARTEREARTIAESNLRYESAAMPPDVR
jgi:hypothetical protein